MQSLAVLALPTGSCVTGIACLDVVRLLSGITSGKSRLTLTSFRQLTFTCHRLTPSFDYEAVIWRSRESLITHVQCLLEHDSLLSDFAIIDFPQMSFLVTKRCGLRDVER